ncbi:unnamed protein product, partial [Meganyctiphanes norvegica]
KTYKWLNGDEVTAGWREDQPNTYKSWRCVAIMYYAWPGTDDSGLEVHRCKDYRRLICQISNTPTTPAPVECPSVWESTSLGCFHISVDHKKWGEAQEWCEAHGS